MTYHRVLDEVHFEAMLGEAGVNWTNGWVFLSPQAIFWQKSSYFQEKEMGLFWEQLFSTRSRLCSITR
jgi:hypothetical protein